MLKNRIEYGIAFAASIILFLFYHNFFFFYLLCVVLALPVISYFVSKQVWAKIEVNANIPLITVAADNDIPIDFKVKNQSVLPMPGVRLEYIVDNHFYPNNEIQEMSLPLRKGEHNYKWNIKSIYAGNVRVISKKMRMQDYLGLFVFTRDWQCECSVSVIPIGSDVIMSVIEKTVSEGDEQEKDTLNSTEDVTQIKQFREYIPGDRMQKVNWKISAKQDTLYVKEYEQEFNQTLTLLVELRRDREEIGFLDEIITAFYSAAQKLLEMEIKFRVQWYDCFSNRFMSEFVDEPDGLLDALRQMYMMESYTEYYAFENYKEAPHKEFDMAIYFTSHTFAGADDSQRIGTYKESVALICL